MDFLKENPQVFLKDPLKNVRTGLKDGLSEVNLPLSNFCISNFYQVSLVLLVHFHLNSLIRLQTSFERQMWQSYNGFLKTVIMLSLKYSHICLSHDYFFFCIIWECFRYEFLPPRMFFSSLILSELCAMSRAYLKFFITPHISKLFCVCLSNIPPRFALLWLDLQHFCGNQCHLWTGLHACNHFLFVLPASILPPTSTSPHKHSAVGCFSRLG